MYDNIKIFIDMPLYSSDDEKPMDCKPKNNINIIIGQTYLTFDNNLIKFIGWAYNSYNSKDSKIYFAETIKKNPNDLLLVYDPHGYYMGLCDWQKMSITKIISSSSNEESQWSKKNIKTKFGLEEKINLI